MKTGTDDYDRKSAAANCFSYLRSSRRSAGDHVTLISRWQRASRGAGKMGLGRFGPTTSTIREISVCVLLSMIVGDLGIKLWFSPYMKPPSFCESLLVAPTYR